MLPYHLIEAFLAVGAAAVVSKSPQHTSDLSAAEVAAYFRELYTALFDKQISILDAVNAAGELLAWHSVVLCLPHYVCWSSYSLRSICRDAQLRGDCVASSARVATCHQA